MLDNLQTDTDCTCLVEDLVLEALDKDDILGSDNMYHVKQWLKVSEACARYMYERGYVISAITHPHYSFIGVDKPLDLFG